MSALGRCSIAKLNSNSIIKQVQNFEVIYWIENLDLSTQGELVGQLYNSKSQRMKRMEKRNFRKFLTRAAALYHLLPLWAWSREGNFSPKFYRHTLQAMDAPTGVWENQSTADWLPCWGQTSQELRWEQPWNRSTCSLSCPQKFTRCRDSSCLKPTPSPGKDHQEYLRDNKWSPRGMDDYKSGRE